MNQLMSIRIFARVAECLNFAEAARQLGISASVVTRSVATLEQHLGVRLINRTTRRVSLTLTGETYRRCCVELIRQLELMDECVSVATTQPTGPLKIASSSCYAATDLPDVLAAYRRDEPRANFELTVFDNMADVAVHEFDVCFGTERRLRDSSLVCRPLAPTRDVIVASPAYLSRCGTPRKPEELSRHDVLLAADAPSRYWAFRDSHGTQRVIVQPVLSMQSPFLIKRAVEAGLGVARLSHSTVQDELRDGRLLPLLTDVSLCDAERTVWVLYSGQPNMSAAARSFVDFVVARYRDEPPRAEANGHAPVGAAQHRTGNSELLRNGIL